MKKTSHANYQSCGIEVAESLKAKQRHNNTQPNNNKTATIIIPRPVLEFNSISLCHQSSKCNSCCCFLLNRKMKHKPATANSPNPSQNSKVEQISLQMPHQIREVWNNRFHVMSHFKIRFLIHHWYRGFVSIFYCFYFHSYLHQ
jgi:hypothetical protein